jgi:hypothetical protein
MTAQVGTLELNAGNATPQKRWMIWTGRAVSALPTLALLMSGSMKLLQQPQMVETFTGTYGYPKATLVALGVLELTCAILYAIPQTAALGAILLTGYLGGAVATHVRVGQEFAAPVILGVLFWAGLFLRDARLRSLVPFRRQQTF